MSLLRLVSMSATGLLLVSACISAPNHSRPADVVVAGTAGGVTALDWADGRTVYQAPNAVATPDWSRVVVSSDSALEVMDGQTGAHQAQVDVPGGLTASVLSTDGRRVALAPPSAASTFTDAWQPAGRETTRIVVADPSGAVEARTFDLPGNFEPDAFANDDNYLFVLEYQPPRAPDSYQVKQLDLRTGRLSAVASRSKVAVPEENMRGTRRMHVLAPDDKTLFTLYTHQPADPASGMTASSSGLTAFVHVLSLSDNWAYCLDLPQPFGIGPASANSLALSPDGKALYVSDRSSGTIARVDTTQLTVQATANVGADPAAASGFAAAQVGPDGDLFLSGGSDVSVVDPKTLAVVRRLPAPGPTNGLGLASDGQRLFLSTGESIVAVDPGTGAELGRVSMPGSGRIEHVATPMR